MGSFTRANCAVAPVISRLANNPNDHLYKIPNGCNELWEGHDIFSEWSHSEIKMFGHLKLNRYKYFQIMKLVQAESGIPFVELHSVWPSNWDNCDILPQLVLHHVQWPPAGPSCSRQGLWRCWLQTSQLGVSWLGHLPCPWHVLQREHADEPSCQPWSLACTCSGDGTTGELRNNDWKKMMNMCPQ